MRGERILPPPCTSRHPTSPPPPPPTPWRCTCRTFTRPAAAAGRRWGPPRAQRRPARPAFALPRCAARTWTPCAYPRRGQGGVTAARTREHRGLARRLRLASNHRMCAPARSPQATSTLCENPGPCRFGDRCMYAHSKSEAELFRAWKAHVAKASAQRGPRDALVEALGGPGDSWRGAWPRGRGIAPPTTAPPPSESWGRWRCCSLPPLPHPSPRIALGPPPPPFPDQQPEPLEGGVPSPSAVVNSHDHLPRRSHSRSDLQYAAIMAAEQQALWLQQQQHQEQSTPKFCHPQARREGGGVGRGGDAPRASRAGVVVGGREHATLCWARAASHPCALPPAFVCCSGTRQSCACSGTAAPAGASASSNAALPAGARSAGPQAPNSRAVTPPCRRTQAWRHMHIRAWGGRAAASAHALAHERVHVRHKQLPWRRRARGRQPALGAAAPAAAAASAAAAAAPSRRGRRRWVAALRAALLCSHAAATATATAAAAAAAQLGRVAGERQRWPG